ncbi:HD domain-containing protein [Candidatus Roizmanbacteria bacterium]|nr:HD domain-containing protein [Candidatus Roizmanbacteria bacterium]
MSNSTDAAHGLVHTTGVVENTLKIARAYPEVDSDLLELCAYWHDVGRLYNPIHEELSARLLINNLKEAGIKDIQEKVFQAIAFHKWNMNPKTIEGEIIRDADKLDFLSIERWETALQAGTTEHLKDIAVLLPRLRGEILHLPESKILYDSLLPPFIDFTYEKQLSRYFDFKLPSREEHS